MRTFGTGATRNDDSKKNDYRGFISPLAVREYGNYMTEHRTQKDGTVRASDNWKKGISRLAYLSSLLRHTEDIHLIMEGHTAINPDTGQVVTLKEALSAAFFNVQGLLHEVVLGRDVQDKEERPIPMPGDILEHNCLLAGIWNVGIDVDPNGMCANTQKALWASYPVDGAVRIRP